MSKKEVLFFGNCQPDVLRWILNLPVEYNCKYIPVHWDTVVSEEYLKETVQKSDVIICQPVKDGYRGFSHLNTKFILDNKRDETVMIIFNSCFFKFYFFDHISNIEKNGVSRKLVYDRKYMVEYYKQGKSPEDYIADCIEDPDFKSVEELESYLQEDFDELDKRYDEMIEKYNGSNVHHISLKDYIVENFRERLLFYTPNHPSKEIFHYLSKVISEILQVKTNVKTHIDTLSHTVSPIYKCVGKIVNFELRNHPMKMLGSSDVNDIVKLFFKEYDELL